MVVDFAAGDGESVVGGGVVAFEDVEPGAAEAGDDPALLAVMPEAIGPGSGGADTFLFEESEGGEGFGLDPEVLLFVAGAALAVETVD